MQPFKLRELPFGLLLVTGLMFVLVRQAIIAWTSIISVIASCIVMAVLTALVIRDVVTRPQHLDERENMPGFHIIFAATWVCLLIAGFAGAYSAVGIINTETNLPTTDAFECLYFSCVTWTTLGYGDFRPSPLARPLTATQSVLGYIYMGVIISIVFRFLSTKPNEKKKVTVNH